MTGGRGARPTGRVQVRTYTLAEVAGLLGLSRAVIAGFIAAGFVTPKRGPRREYHFEFPDLVLLRAAQGLQSAQIAPRRILSALRRLRATLPADMPLSGLRLSAVGNDVVVRDGGAPWQATSGQWLLDFEVDASAAPAAAVHHLHNMHNTREGRTPIGQGHARSGPAGAGHAADAPVAEPRDWFQRGTELEASAPAEAEAAYRRAIAAAPTRADAYLNLGVLLADAGRHAEALAVYRQGLRHCPGEALLHYNLAVALEDAKQPEAAIGAYEQAVKLDPQMADAHFNAARLHDMLGRAKPAIRHYSAYRRLRGPATHS